MPADTAEAHMRQYAFTVGLDPDEYVASKKPTCPDEGRYLLEIFAELSEYREWKVSMGGGEEIPCRLSLSLMRDYEHFTGVSLDRLDLHVLARLDRVWMEAVISGRHNRQSTTGGEQHPDQVGNGGSGQAGTNQ